MSELIFSRPREPFPKPPKHRRREFWWLSSLPLLAFLLLPVLILLVQSSPEGLWHGLRRAEVVQALWISVTTSTIAALIAVILGMPVALLMARREFRFKRVLDSLLDLPIVLPPAVAGVALLLTFGRQGPLGGWLATWGIQIAFTKTAVIMAQTFIAAPFFIKSAAIGFARIDPELEQAAALDGATTWEIFRTISLPLARMALLSGALVTWARALGEFGATIIFAGNFPGRTQTMPLAIYLGFEINFEVALTLSVILILITFLILFLVKNFFQGE